MKKPTAVIFLSVLTACTNTHQYGANLVGVRAGEEQYNLRIRMDSQIRSGMFSSDIRNEVYLYINDVLAVRGPLHRDQTGHLQGNHNDKAVLLDCINPGILSRTQCTVHIDGRDAGTLPLTLGANR